MSYCPKCDAEVRANARFCSKCGYKQADAGSASASSTSTSEHALLKMHSTSQASLTPPPPISTAIPTRAVRPTVKRVPARPHVTNLPSKSFQAAPTDRPDEAKKEEQPATPPPGTLLSEEKPSTPPSRGLIRPPFPSAKEQKTNTSQASEQETQQATMVDAHDDFADIDEGFIETSRAAQRWRSSWRNRQRSEAGPAMSVSRGQSSVPQPLLVMQDSLMRIRAIIAPKQDIQKASPAFWITVFLMICLIGGLGAYIAFSYLPADNNAVRSPAPAATGNTSRGELTSPVELQLRDAATEIVITPNPLVAVLASAGNTCQANTLLLLINLGNTPANWGIQMDETTREHIQFPNRGKPDTQGVLAPAGQHGDSQVLTLMCTHVQNGDTYHFTINVNNIPWPGTVIIQTHSANP